MNALDAIGQPVRADLERVRTVIGECVARQPDEIRESLSYYFSSGGKFMRPMLALMSAGAAAGGPLKPVHARDAVTFAAAVEFVHNASLVHDDIMDGDTFRRNMKTLHAQYGQTCAVLLGDVLHITVFDLLGRVANREAARLMTATIRDMCYGQLLDVRRKKRTAADYDRIIRYKTGALMAAACEGGVIMSGADAPERAARDAGRYGMLAGMLYQMADDYLDGDAGVRLTPDDIADTARKSKTYLKTFKDSPYKAGLNDFIDYIVSMVYGKQEEKHGKKCK